MKVLVLDVGNTNTKCHVYDVVFHGTTPQTAETKHCYSEKKATPRGHPWDLADTARSMICRAGKAEKVDVGIITAFGDAFIYFDPEGNHRPRFVFADEPVTPRHKSYDISGFPSNIEISGVRSLRIHEGAHWNNIVPVNCYLAAKLCTRPMEVSQGAEDIGKSFRKWDLTQASASGDWDFIDEYWLKKYPEYPDGIVQCSHKVGNFKGMAVGRSEHKTVLGKPALVDAGIVEMPLLAGGLDNAFLDTVDQTPYIVAGTWTVVSVIKDKFEPTKKQEEHGVRWLMSANENYLAQTVRRSEKPVLLSHAKQIIDDLLMLGLDTPEHQTIRVLGGFSTELVDKLNSIQTAPKLDWEFIDCDVQFESTAIYAAYARILFEDWRHDL